MFSRRNFFKSIFFPQTKKEPSLVDQIKEAVRSALKQEQRIGGILSHYKN